MSLIAGLNYVAFGIMLADSRLSWSKPAGLVRRDVCQKLFPFTEAGLISWCGDLLPARFVMRRLVDEKERSNPWFLLKEDRVRATLSTAALHACPRGECSFIAMLINPYETAFEGEYTPRVEMAVIDLVSNGDGITRVEYEHPFMKSRVRGSGSFVRRPMKESRLHTRVFAASSADPDFEHAVINKCLMAESEIGRLAGERNEPTVGGLFQLAYVLSDRVRALSYDRWVRLKGRFGTYARLEVDSGDWYQTHPPTAKTQRLANPFIEAVEEDFETDLLFELEGLDEDTAGVVRNAKNRVRSRFISAHGISGAPALYRPVFVPVTGQEHG